MKDVVEIARALRRKLSAEIACYDEFLRVAEGLCALYAAEGLRERVAGAGQGPNPHAQPTANGLAATPGLPPAPVKGG